MPGYSAQITATGWFNFTADDDDDAANVASELTKYGVPIGAKFSWCKVDDIERDVWDEDVRV